MDFYIRRRAQLYGYRRLSFGLLQGHCGDQLGPRRGRPSPYRRGSGKASWSDPRDRAVEVLRSGLYLADAACSLAEGFDPRHPDRSPQGSGALLRGVSVPLGETERGKYAEAKFAASKLPKTARPRAGGHEPAASAEMAECQSQWHASSSFPMC